MSSGFHRVKSPSEDEESDSETNKTEKKEVNVNPGLVQEIDELINNHEEVKNQSLNNQ
jgi:hypothetical protein